MTRSHEENVLNTYRYLRVAMPVLVAVLGASVIFQIAAFDCWPGSISAYYYTASRAAFVSCLCAIGTCLIVYRGNTDPEDVTLNVSGFLAFVVAFVPTTVDTTCRASNVPSREELAAAVQNNVAAVLVGGAATVVIAWLVRRGTVAPRRGPLATGTLIGTTVALAAGAAVFLVADDLVLSRGHYTAAIAMFVGIGLVVAMNTRPYTERDPEAASPTVRYDRAYKVVLGAMIASGAVITGTGLALGKDSAGHWVWGEWIFWLEAVLIVEFAVFWGIQTWELRNVRDRSELQQSGDPVRSKVP